MLLSSLQLQLNELEKSSKPKEPVWLPVANYIMACESGGNPNAVNYKDAEITGYVSYGLYQFQFPTWWNAARKYKVISENVTKEEGIKLYKQPAYNAAVAHALIADGEVGHWKFCYNRYLVQAKNNVPLYLR